MPSFSIDPAAKYILTNAQTGPNVALASTPKNDSLVFVPLGNGISGDQLWYFASTKRESRYRLQTFAKGDFNAVDISSYSGQNSITAHFVAVAENTGQYWALDKWDDDSVRITNDFTGPDIRLGIDSNGMPGIQGGDNKGSHWTLSRFDGTVQTMTVSGTVSNIVVASSTLSTSTATFQSTNDHTKKLSTGVIAGASVGGFVGLMAIVGIAILLWKKSGRSAPFSRGQHRDAMTRNPIIDRMN